MKDPVAGIVYTPAIMKVEEIHEKKISSVIKATNIIVCKSGFRSQLTLLRYRLMRSVVTSHLKNMLLDTWLRHCAECKTDGLDRSMTGCWHFDIIRYSVNVLAPSKFRNAVSLHPPYPPSWVQCTQLSAVATQMKCLQYSKSFWLKNMFVVDK